MSTELPRAYAAFHLERTTYTSGRLRLRVPEWRNDRESLRTCTERLQKLTSVLEVSFNARTGSILIEHDEADTQDLLAKIGHLRALRLCRRDELSPKQLNVSFEPFTEQEKNTLKLLLNAGITVFQLFYGHPFAAASSFAKDTEDFWERIRMESRA